MTFIAQGENFQAFYKVLKDLKAKNFKDVLIIYVAESEEEMPFLSEVEYWMKSTNWQIDLMVEESGATKDWQYMKGDIHAAPAYRNIPEPNSKIGTFVSIQSSLRVDLSDRLYSKGYTGAYLHWLN